MDSSVIFLNMDSFEEWRSTSPFVKDLMGKRTLKESVSKKITKKWSSKKRSQKAHTSELNCLFGYDEIYCSKRIYEDMAIFITDKFVEYRKVLSRSNDPELPGDKVTLITPFNKEREYLEKQLAKKTIEVLTIDKSQGIDRDLVTVLCSTREMKEKELLSNWRRLNVACTRAKRKLIFVGSVVDLRKIGIMDKLLDLCE